MGFIDKNTVISGRSGVVTAKINGRVEEIAEIKSLTATINLSKADFKAIGTKVTQKKINGWDGTGSMTVYFVTSRWNELILDYTKYGKVTHFDIIIDNEETSSEIGKQTIKLSRCLLDGGDVAKIDTDADFLDASYNFTFEDWDVVKKFDKYTTI